MDSARMKELLLQSLEHEKRGVEVYKAAIGLAVNRDLKKQWEENLLETEHHVRVLTGTLNAFEIDPDERSPGREIVRGIGLALVDAINKAITGNATAAQLVACECVSLAETKHHLDGALIGQIAERLAGDAGAALKQAYSVVEDQEDEHLGHNNDWCRELWLESLGLRAVLPPQDERKHVQTATGAAC